MSQQNIYDNETFFENFKSLRASDVNYNDCIETPMLLSTCRTCVESMCWTLAVAWVSTRSSMRTWARRLCWALIFPRKCWIGHEATMPAPTIVYQRLPMEELDQLEDAFDVVTSSLVFDYVEDFDRMMRLVYDRMKLGAYFVFSTSHPMATAWDGTYTAIHSIRNGTASVCQHQ